MSIGTGAEVMGRKNRKMRNIYREFLESRNGGTVMVRTLKAYSWTFAVIVGLALLATSSGGSASLWHLFFQSSNDAARPNIFSRRIASMAFPQVGSESDTDDILTNYTPYLRFVLEVGNQTDSKTAKRLAQTFEKLRSHYPQGAALFLKGLRFEMVQKTEFMVASPASLNSSSPEMHRWVGKFMKDWLRECDEHLFRAVAMDRSSRVRAN